MSRNRRELLLLTLAHFYYIYPLREGWVCYVIWMYSARPNLNNLKRRGHTRGLSALFAAMCGSVLCDVITVNCYCRQS